MELAKKSPRTLSKEEEAEEKLPPDDEEEEEEEDEKAPPPPLDLADALPPPLLLDELELPAARMHTNAA